MSRAHTAFREETVENTRKRALARAARRGMTLIELMVVVTVLALMATAVSISVVKVLNHSKEAKARNLALVKPTLGDTELGTANNRKHLEDISILDETSVAKWIWPTEKKHPDMCGCWT